MMRPLLFFGLALLGLACACDRPGNPVVLPRKTVAEIRSVSQLNPNRTVHVAVDSSGKIYYSVETEGGYDGVVAVEDNGLPRATQLTSANVLATMGESFGGNGSIQGLVGGPEGTLWFYFTGGKGRRIRACVGQFNPQTESIGIVFDSKALTDLSSMGDSLPLARGQLVVGGPRVYLLLRHPDAWSLFHFPNQRRALNVEFKLAVPYTKLWDDDRELELTRERYALSPGPGDGLLLMDRQAGAVWKLDSAGRALPRMVLTGLPSELSNPVVLEDGGLMFLAAESEPFQADASHIVSRRVPQTIYPALLQIRGDEIKPIGRDDIQVIGGIPIFALRIRELVPAPDGSWAGYDQSSGQVVRIRLMEVD
jgi:hypothetical protein